MVACTYKGGKVSWRRMGDTQAVLVVYSGAQTVESYSVLRDRAVAATAHASVLLIRMDRCTLLMHPDEIPAYDYRRAIPPAAAVVPTEQWDAWSRAYAPAWDAGMVCQVYPASLQDLAREWVWQQAARLAQESLIATARARYPMFFPHDHSVFSPVWSQEGAEEM